MVLFCITYTNRFHHTHSLSTEQIFDLGELSCITKHNIPQELSGIHIVRLNMFSIIFHVFAITTQKESSGELDCVFGIVYIVRRRDRVLSVYWHFFCCCCWCCSSSSRWCFSFSVFSCSYNIAVSSDVEGTIFFSVFFMKINIQQCLK